MKYFFTEFSNNKFIKQDISAADNNELPGTIVEFITKNKEKILNKEFNSNDLDIIIDILYNEANREISEVLEELRDYYSLLLIYKYHPELQNQWLYDSIDSYSHDLKLSYWVNLYGIDSEYISIIKQNLQRVYESAIQQILFWNPGEFVEYNKNSVNKDEIPKLIPDEFSINNILIAGYYIDYMNKYKRRE